MVSMCSCSSRVCKVADFLMASREVTAVKVTMNQSTSQHAVMVGCHYSKMLTVDNMPISYAERRVKAFVEQFQET
jgi:hypothetical protein